MKRIRRYELYHFTKKREFLPVVAKEFYEVCARFTAENERHADGALHSVGVLRAMMKHGVLKHTKKYARIIDEVSRDIHRIAQNHGTMRQNIICAALSFAPIIKHMHIIEVVDLAAPFEIPTDALYRELRSLNGRRDVHIYGKPHTVTVSEEWFSIVPTPTEHEGGQGI